VKLEIIKGVHSVKKGAKAARNKSSSDDEEMKSGMGRMLDELRFKLATDHGGIFPHSVLSSQHITALCSSKPVSLDQVYYHLSSSAEVYHVPDLSSSCS
jgi:ATP-dependent DNA helicase Q1